MKKLLVVGSDSIHVYNFIELVKDYFDDVLLLTDTKHRAYRVEVIGIDFSLGFSSLGSIKKIHTIAKEFNPTTVHIHQANSYAFLTLLALRNFRCQKILTAWGSDILINPKQSKILKWIAQYNLNHVNAITADSNSVLEEANRLVTKNLERHNINFGLEVPVCRVKKENIIYSNRLHKALYNIDKIILSFHKFVQANSSWRLIIAGSGEETENLKALVRSLDLENHVEFVGWVDAKTNYSYYCKSKLYVSVPSSDSVSLSLVEAIISDAVPFVSNLKANKELINNSVGFVVDDLENIPFEEYIKIDKVLFDSKKEEIKRYFSKEVNREKYLALYRRVNEL